MNEQVLHAFYDLGTSPLTYDSAIFMVVANAHALHGGKAGFQLYVVPADSRDGFRAQSPKDLLLPGQRKHLRLERIILAIGGMFPRCASIRLLASRADAFKIRSGLEPNEMFPPHFDAGVPVYDSAYLLRIHKIGWPVQSMVPPEDAMTWARRKKRRGKLAVITLRQSDMQPGRNSKLPEWEKVREFLEGRGYRVVTVPDTDALLTEHHGPWSGEISEGASVNLLKRAALYEVADLNLMVSGGFATLAMLNPRVRFVVCSMIHMEYETTRPEWLEKVGFAPDRDPPWFRPYQHILWKPDTFENLRPEIEKLML
jgi:hypothetical protein